MAEYNSKEEYEKWKSNRAVINIANKKASNKTLIIAIASTAVVSIVISFLIFKSFIPDTSKETSQASNAQVSVSPESNPKQEISEETKIYLDDASKALAELEKLSSSLKIGLSYADYTRKLGEVDYPISYFIRKYEEKSENSGPSYKTIKFSLDSYARLFEKLQFAQNLSVTNFEKFLSPYPRLIIEPTTKKMASETDEHVRKSWGILSKLIMTVRRLIDENDTDKIKNFTRELELIYQVWNEEQSNYDQRVESYKKVLDNVQKNMPEMLKKQAEMERALGR